MRTIEPNPQWSPYPEGRITEACRDIERDASFFLAGFDDLPPLTRWETLRNAGERISAPYVDYEISDGIPMAIGDEEQTKPTSAPRGSVAVTEGPRCKEDCIGRCPACEPPHWTGRSRSSGMRW